MKEKFDSAYAVFGIVPRMFDSVKKFLIILEEDKGGKYGFSGGCEKQIDCGDMEITLTREISEETGILCNPGSIVYSVPKSPTHILHIMTAKYCDGEIKFGPETIDAKWITPEEIDKMIEDRKFLYHHKLAWEKSKLFQEKLEAAHS